MDIGLTFYAVPSRFIIYPAHKCYTQGAKSLYLAKKRLEVTSPAIVVLNAFLDSSDLPNEGLSGLLWKFFGVML